MIRILFLVLFVPALGLCELYVGIGTTEITPPLGTPSAGYAAREGKGMQGVHDPLLATALLIDNGEKSIVLCSVDHLGFSYAMVQNVTREVQSHPDLSNCAIFIASSHTHSGGGAYLDTPVIGEYLAGCYDSAVRRFYEQQTVNAILQAAQNKVKAKIGIGYGQAAALSAYRGLYPVGIEPLSDVSIIKVTQVDDTPLAVLFNYPMHPTVLTGENFLFSADFVGYTRNALKELLGAAPLYFNGAQAEILPLIVDKEDRFRSCQLIGNSLAQTVAEIWERTKTSSNFEINVSNHSYTLIPQETPQGLKLPLDRHETEINLLVFNRLHAFITIPGELSCLYDYQLKAKAKGMGLNLSIFGLTNDAHGYIILPQAWEHETFESQLSFGGKNYGEEIMLKVDTLLQDSQKVWIKE